MLRIIFVILCFICVLCCVTALTHCEITQIPKRLVVRNVTNVVYTMESSCKICVQQASRLPKLKRYLEKKGIKTHIIIGVSHKADRLSGLVPHIQVNSRHVWRALGEQNNHFYIIDRCGRLVYEVINPWSNLNLSFVKAAVAATAHSHPCGLCPMDYTHTSKEEEIQEFPSMENYDQSVLENTSPLKVNVRLRHTHRGDPNVYNYIVKVVGQPDYHGHHLQEHETPSHTTLITSSTEVPQESEREKLLQSSRSTSKADEQNVYSTSSEDLTDSSIPINSMISHSTESSIVISRKTPQTTESSSRSTDKLTELSSLSSSISYTLNSESHNEANETKDLVDPINHLNKTLSISYIHSSTETVTENIQEESTRSDKELSGERTSSDYYYEDSSSSETNEELTEEQKAEVRNLKAHYSRIIDWINFVRDDDYD